MILTGCRERALYSVLNSSVHVSDSVDGAKGQNALQDTFVKHLILLPHLNWFEFVQCMFMENQFANLFQLPDFFWLTSSTSSPRRDCETVFTKVCDRLFCLPHVDLSYMNTIKVSISLTFCAIHRWIVWLWKPQPTCVVHLFTVYTCRIYENIERLDNRKE